MASSTHSIGEPEELATLYLSGAMTPGESAAFEAHLASGCAACTEQVKRLETVVEHLVSNVEPMNTDPRVRDAIMAQMAAESRDQNSDRQTDPQIWKNWQPDSDASDHVIHQAARSGWESTGIDGIDIRRLFVDRHRNRMTAMIRMAPGTAYPAHLHDEPEECLVLEGDLRTGGQVLHSGDYERRVAGSRHAIQSTKDGCLLLIVSSLTDELL